MALVCKGDRSCPVCSLCGVTKTKGWDCSEDPVSFELDRQQNSGERQNQGERWSKRSLWKWISCQQCICVASATPCFILFRLQLWESMILATNTTVHLYKIQAPRSLHSAADADSVQRPVRFWKHESYKPSPTNSLRSSNSFGIATSPISIHRDEKQFDFFHDYGWSQILLPSERKIHSYSSQKNTSPRYNRTSPYEQRSDPPGRRMETCDSENRDPPNDSRSTHTNVTPMSKRQMPSPCNSMKSLRNTKAPQHDDNKLVTSRGQRKQPDNGIRDPHPENTADKPHLTRSVRNSNTPKSKERRPCATTAFNLMKGL